MIDVPDDRVIYAFTYLIGDDDGGYIVRHERPNLDANDKFNLLLEIGKFICDELKVTPKQMGNLIQEYIDINYTE